MSFKHRLGVVFLVVIVSTVLVSAMPVSTVQKTETNSKTVKLSEKMLEAEVIIAEEIQVQDNLHEIAKKTENKISVFFISP